MITEQPNEFTRIDKKFAAASAPALSLCESVELIRDHPRLLFWVWRTDPQGPILAAGAQGASRPRTGPSPPEHSLKSQSGSHEPPVARRKRTPGIS